MSTSLKQSILQEARRLGFVLAGVTSAAPPPHLATFEAWLDQGRQASMDYLATPRSRARRADPLTILPECKSILALAVPYSPPSAPGDAQGAIRGRVAAYAYGDDYHEVLPARLRVLVDFIETEVGRPVANRWYTDTGPILERDLAQRAGLGWIGKNTCLIHPRHGSYFLLAEILMDLALEPDAPFTSDHCGSCSRCIEACPTDCILPDRTIEAGRCISYLTIEMKGDVPPDLRSRMGAWVFGCDICQAVCPWNRFAAEQGEAVFRGDEESRHPQLIRALELSPDEFNRKFKTSSVRRAKRRGYLRNVAIALGNIAAGSALPALGRAAQDAEALVRGHAEWAIGRITGREDKGAERQQP